MKTNKKDIKDQRFIIERKIKPWLEIRSDRVPPSGWLKAIRGALGINTRQLAARLKMEHSAILQFEKNEATGKVTLKSLQKVAHAMNCRLVYAIIPDDSYTSLDAILDAQSLKAAITIVEKVDHTMRLEKQGVSPEQSRVHTKELAKQLKDSMDPMLWGTPKKNY